ncbi:MAG: moaA [Clostridia bacterium]|jgi:cyclic pyranopterin phosphate synthase|nr:moaA [Clostridia bacterium]
MPAQGVYKKSHKDILKLEEIELLAQEFVALGIDKIRITGGEPLVRKGILTLIEKVASIDGLKDFSMTTNGTLLKKFAKDLKAAGLKRLNVSLDTLNDEKYSYITRGGSLKHVLEGIEEAQKAGLNPIKMNVVVIKNFNEDEIDNFINLTRYINMDIRFIELMSIGEVARWSNNRFLSNTKILDKRKELIKMAKEDPASPADYYKLPDGIGRIGLISPISCKFCQSCNRIRLTADGRLKHCLHSDDEINLKELLPNRKLVREVISNSILQKPFSHHLEEGKYIIRNMVQIGG